MAGKSINLWDRIMMAITFAEAGEDATAKEMLDMNKKKQSQVRKEKTTEQRPSLRV